LKRYWETQGFIVVITAPSGTGKTTVIRELIERESRLRYSVSATTRPRRSAEVHGSDYFFFSEQEFDEKLEKELFAEWAEVHGYRYGTLKAQIEEILEQGGHVMMDVDVQGARHLREIYPGGLFIYLMPPSMKELKARLSRRGTEDEASFEQRLNDAVAEIESLAAFDYLVVNDELEDTVNEITGIIRSEELKIGRISDLTKKIRDYLQETKE
jgi:guanylate kinase